MTFRDGPAGVRAALRDGPDIWELVCIEPDIADRAQRIDAVADYLELSVEQAQAAFDYYDAHREEIDERVRSNRELSERAEAQWRAEQQDRMPER